MHAEILAPAGNKEALDAAIAAGADAIYFGLPLFGARAYAKNFTLEEASKIIDAAHLQGVKIYITMNTLLEEDQMEQAFDWARQLYEMGADALIIQDLGLLHLLHERIPDLELHASTQLSVSKPWQIEKLKELGVKRVVLAREASLEDIEACARTGMELEVFIHGAICISWSGQCQFSRIRYDRSGNKGACAQPCRMEYTLSEDGKPVKTNGNFLLSPKDLSILQDIPALEKAGVSSLKIEGRMKSPVYVFESVQKAIKAREGKKLSSQDEKELKTAFNREYTKGHAFKVSGKDLMNPKTSNHQGIPAGKVIRQNKGRVWIKLADDLHQNDGLRLEGMKEQVGLRVNFLYDEKGKLIRQASKGDVIQIDMNSRIQPGSMVRKTIDFLMEENTQRAIRQTRRQSDVNFHLTIEKAGKPMKLKADDGKNAAEVTGEIVQPAQKRPTSTADFEKQLRKTGNTWAKAANIEINVPENIFVPLGQINALRNAAIEALEAKKLEKYIQPVLDYEVKLEQPAALPNIIELRKKDQVSDYKLEAVSAFGFENTKPAASLQDEEGFLTSHLGKGEIVTGMNITNSYALAALLKMGYQGALLSDELPDDKRKAMLEAFKARYGFDAPVMVNVYEHPRLMIMNHCPVNTALKDGSRKNCALCRVKEYRLKGLDGKEAILHGNPDCQMEIFDEEPLNRLDEINQLKKEGISAFRIGLLNESVNEAKKLEESLLSKLEQPA